MTKTVALFCFAIFLSGCGSSGPDELDRLMKEDPDFKQLILQRDRLHGEMKAIKQSMLSKKKVMDAEIDQVRLAYDTYSKAENQKIEKYQAVIDASRLQMKQDIMHAQGSLSQKENEYKDYAKSLESAKQFIHGSKGITFSSQEKKQLEEKILLLSEKMRPLREEIEDLKLRIRLKKQKIDFLR